MEDSKQLIELLLLKGFKQNADLTSYAHFSKNNISITLDIKHITLLVNSTLIDTPTFKRIQDDVVKGFTDCKTYINLLI
jgi:hypothetical protein